MCADYYDRKSKGMTLLRHLSARRKRAKNKNPNAIIGITVQDADEIINDYKGMKAQRDEAMRLLGLRSLPNQSGFMKDE